MKLPMRSKMGQSPKLRRIGAMGSMKMAKKAENAPRKYASGGIVEAGPAVEGDAPKARLDKPSRSKGKKDAGKKGTTVNIVIASGSKPAAPEGGPPMPMPPPGMPMRASGGRVKRADGGWVGEGDTGQKMRDAAHQKRQSGTAAGATGAMVGPFTALHLGRPGRVLGALFGAGAAGIAAKDFAAAKKMDKLADEAEGRAKGGRVHDDKAQDEALFNKMIKAHDAKKKS